MPRVRCCAKVQVCHHGLLSPSRQRPARRHAGGLSQRRWPNRRRHVRPGRDRRDDGCRRPARAGVLARLRHARNGGSRCSIRRCQYGALLVVASARRRVLRHARRRGLRRHCRRRPAPPLRFGLGQHRANHVHRARRDGPSPAP